MPVPFRHQDSWRVRIALVALLSALIGGTCPPSRTHAADVLSKKDENQLFEILREALNQSGSVVSVHAAESMIRLGREHEVLPQFRPHVEGELTVYRLLTWRVLARAERTPAGRTAALLNIRQVLLDPTSDFQIHALESLAKLNAPILPDEAAIVEEIAHAESHPGAPFALWRLAQFGDRPQALTRLTELLKSDHDVIRLRAAYVLWHLQPLPDEASQSLGRLADQSPLPASERTLYAIAAGDPRAGTLAREAEKPSARYMLGLSLAGRKDSDAQQQLEQLLEDPDLDVRAGAAFGLLLSKAN